MKHRPPNIPFNKPCVLGTELAFINEALTSSSLAGGRAFSLKCEKFIEDEFNIKKAFLCPSGTAALEACALLCDVSINDEIIMPSFTFSSTANAFALRGAKIKFVDIDIDTLNISVKAIERAITAKTKAIVVVHYAGVCCDMDEIKALADKHSIWLIEDAAHAIGSHYKRQSAGSIGHLSCFSFHETKNITAGGEGGALLINDSSLIERANIVVEKGTNRIAFHHGDVSKYHWVGLGSSYLMPEIQSAYLWGQLISYRKINDDRIRIYNEYVNGLKALNLAHKIKLPLIPKYCNANGHLFYFLCENKTVRDQILNYLRQQGVLAVFHYLPLHSSPAGRKFSCFHGNDVNTTQVSERLVRLPLFYGFDETQYVIDKIKQFYKA